MRKKNRKITLANIFRSKAFTIFAILGTIVIGISLAKQIIRKIEISRQISSLETEIHELEQQNSELNGLLEYFNSSAFQEKEARMKLGLKEDGETVVMIPGASDGVPDSGEIEVVKNETPVELSNPAKWKKYFFN